MAEFTYPSIEGPTFAFLNAPCIAFEKYDGSNLRFLGPEARLAQHRHALPLVQGRHAHVRPCH